jgi:hypothetical protein
MQGTDKRAGELFSYGDLENRVGKDHPPRPIRAMVHTASSVLSGDFAPMYSGMGRPSIAPEMLLRAMLLQAVPARVKRLLSSEHFSVDGTLIAAWASIKSFMPKGQTGGDGGSGGGRNALADFRGEKRSNPALRGYFR